MSRRKGKEFDGVVDVAEKLGVSERTVRNLIRKAKLPASRIGSRIKIPKSEFSEWLKGKRVDVK